VCPMTFKIGDKVPDSGIYTVIHDEEHYKSHDVTCIEGSPFPPCNNCGKGVRFKVKMKAEHISKNRWFKKRNWKDEAAKGLGGAKEK
jgi:hypothetical protein